MNINNDCDIENIGYILYMLEQEEKQKEKENNKQDKECNNIIKK